MISLRGSLSDSAVSISPTLPLSHPPFSASCRDHNSEHLSCCQYSAPAGISSMPWAFTDCLRSFPLWGMTCRTLLVKQLFQQLILLCLSLLLAFSISSSPAERLLPSAALIHFRSFLPVTPATADHMGQVRRGVLELSVSV